MFKSVYKSADEIRFSLEPYHRLALFSCGVCANLADVGGIRGARMPASFRDAAWARSWRMPCAGTSRPGGPTSRPWW